MSLGTTLTLLALAAAPLAPAVAAADDFARYVANDTLLGRALPCSDPEKECLRYNRLLHRKTGRCYPMGHGPRGCRFFVERAEFEHGDGHLRGMCLPREPCPDGDFVMAFDGQCLRHREAIQICDGKEGLELAPHFFGGTECVRVQFSPPPPAYVAQPEEQGQCAFPNLRHDLSSARAAESRRLGVRCQAGQSVCFAKGQVWHEPLRSCFPLLEQGPCSEGERLVLELSAPGEGRKRAVSSKCAPLNPCRSNERLMAFDGRCHDASRIRMVLCPSGVLLPNAFGEMSCTGAKDMYKHVILLESVRAESCEIVHKVSHLLTGPGVKVAPDCSLTDQGECARAVNEMLVAMPPHMGYDNELPAPR